MSVHFGIDEAGRGPILGPMVLALVGLTPAQARALSVRGVLDSKRFGASAKARTARAELAAEIAARATVCLHRCVETHTIDAYTARGELNVLEREVAHTLLSQAGAEPGAAITCDGARLFGPLRAHYPCLQALDRAEDKSVAVAAASIVAKHHRDRAMADIAARYAPEFGKIEGGGYINPATTRFLLAYRDKHGDLPPETRRSWKCAF